MLAVKIRIPAIEEPSHTTSYTYPVGRILYICTPMVRIDWDISSKFRNMGEMFKYGREDFLNTPSVN